MCKHQISPLNCRAPHSVSAAGMLTSLPVRWAAVEGGVPVYQLTLLTVNTGAERVADKVALPCWPSSSLPSPQVALWLSHWETVCKVYRLPYSSSCDAQKTMTQLKKFQWFDCDWMFLKPILILTEDVSSGWYFNTHSSQAISYRTMSQPLSVSSVCDVQSLPASLTHV